MRSNISLLCLKSLLLSALLGCEDEPVPVGGACNERGRQSECVDGAICTNLSGSDAEATGDTNRCLPLCESDDDCAADEGCRGISRTSLKSCQPNDL